MALLLACGTEPSRGPLVGEFGGQFADGTRALLTLTDTSVHLQLPCAGVRLPAPLLADSAGNFAATGTWQASTTEFAPAQVQGLAFRDVIDGTVTVTRTPPLRWSGQLRRGTVPSFNDICPQ